MTLETVEALVCLQDWMKENGKIERHVNCTSH
jgi:hypothetical protein